MKNEDFEEGQSYWNVWKDKGSFNVDTDKSVKKDGVKSIKIYNFGAASARGTLSQTIDGTQLTGKALKVTQWMKSDKLSGIVNLRANFMDFNSKAIGSMDIKTIDIKGTIDWNQQTYTINVPNDSRIKKIDIQYLYDNCTGSLWLDSITGLKVNQVTTNNIVKNGHFEEGQSYWNVWKDKGSFNVDTDKSVKKDGVKSIKIYNTDNATTRGLIGQTLDAAQLKGKKLNMTQWIKSDRLVGTIRLRAIFTDVNGRTISNMDLKTINIKGTKNWNQQTYTINVPNDSKIKNIELQYIYDNCTGTIWLDDITAVKQ
jgi:hypothetical protein